MTVIVCALCYDSVLVIETLKVSIFEIQNREKRVTTESSLNLNNTFFAFEFNGSSALSVPSNRHCFLENNPLPFNVPASFEYTTPCKTLLVLCICCGKCLLRKMKVVLAFKFGNNMKKFSVALTQYGLEAL